MHTVSLVGGRLLLLLHNFPFCPRQHNNPSSRAYMPVIASKACIRTIDFRSDGERRACCLLGLQDAILYVGRELVAADSGQRAKQSCP